MALVYVENGGRDYHAVNKTVSNLLVSVPMTLDGEAVLEQVQARYR